MSVYPSLLSAEQPAVRTALAERLERLEPGKAALAMQYVADDLEDLLEALRVFSATGEKNPLRLWVARQALTAINRSLPYALVMSVVDHLAATLRALILERVLVEDLRTTLDDMEAGIAQLRKRYTDAHFATQQAQYETLAGQSQSFMCLASISGKPQYINAAGRALIGLGPEDSPASTSLRQFHTEATWNLIRGTIVPQINELGSWSGSGQLKHLQTGEVTEVQMTFQLVRDPSTGKPIGLACVHRTLGGDGDAKEQEARKVAILESALDPIITVDHEGKITEFNRAAERTFGLARADALGRRPEQLLFSPFDQGEQQGKIERYVSMREGSMLGKRTEVSAVRANGEIFPAEMAMTISREKGQPVFTFFLRDLSERKKAEQDLRDSEALYHSLVEGLPMNVFRKDLKGRFTFGNQRFCKSLKTTLRQLIGRTDYDFFSRELAEKFRADDQRVFEQREDFETVEEQRLPDGSRSFVFVRKSPVYDAQKRILGIQGIFWDVTDSHLAEERIRESEQRLQAILDNTTAMVFVKDLEGRYVLVNRTWQTLFELNREEALGKNDRELFEAPIAESFLANDRQVLASGQPLQCEEMAPHPEGLHTYLTIKFPLRDATGQINALCGISTDITDRIRAEEELRKSKEAAEAASHAKSAFLANMSHEIRTPLNAVIGMTDLVLDSQLQADQRDYLQMVRDSGEALLTVINDVLDFSKIEAGKMDLESVDFPIRESISTAIRSLALRARGKGLELTGHVAEQVPELLRGDPGRLRQVLLNLLGNALKFTEAGHVALSVSVAAASAEEVRLHFAVEDTGIGIPPDKQEIIFAAFEQADSSMTRRFGGTGLGLAISSRLVELMGGRIWVESQLGQGSVFHFEANFAPASGAPQPSRAPWDDNQLPPTGALRVLLAEDSLVNQKLALGLLEKQGHEVTVASDGLEAVNAALGTAFDLILMDIQMPELDGLEATVAIRKHERVTGQHVPIIAMTAYAMKGDRRRCLEAGMDAYVAKPIRAEELFATIRHTLAALKAGEPVGLAAEPTDYSVPEETLLPTNGHSASRAQAADEELMAGDAALDSSGAARIDWDGALSAVQGDRELLQDVVAAFLEEYEELSVEVQSAIERAEIKTVRRIAHTIKGSMRCFAAQGACDIAYELECLARDGQTALFAPAWCQLSAVVNSMLPELRRFAEDAHTDTDIEPSPADAIP